MWGVSWINFMMDLATIPKTEIKKSATGPADKYISVEDEAAELRKDFGL
jgi:hypothetical protein